MKTPVRHSGLRPTVLALALLAALGPVQAQTSDAKAADAKAAEAKTSEVQASVTVGGAGVSDDTADRAFFGQYNGMRDQSRYGLLDFDYSRRPCDRTAGRNRRLPDCRHLGSSRTTRRTAWSWSNTARTSWAIPCGRNTRG